VQTGRYAGAPRVRALRRGEPAPAGVKRWMPHAATCPAGRRRVPRPRTVQLQLETPR